MERYVDCIILSFLTIAFPHSVFITNAYFIIQKGTLEYFIKWKGWPDSDNTWESEDNV